MALKARYTNANGRLIAEKRSGVRSFYMADGIGSTRALLDNTQTKTDTFTYWPYGEEKTRTGTTPTPFRYVGLLGQYRDASSRNFVRRRPYNPAIGRWLTKDKVWLDRTRYSYAICNPQTFIDRNGLFRETPLIPAPTPVEVPVKGGGAVAGGVTVGQGGIVVAGAVAIVDLGRWIVTGGEQTGPFTELGRQIGEKLFPPTPDSDGDSEPSPKPQPKRPRFDPRIGRRGPEFDRCYDGCVYEDGCDYWANIDPRRWRRCLQRCWDFCVDEVYNPRNSVYPPKCYKDAFGKVPEYRQLL